MPPISPYLDVRDVPSTVWTTDDQSLNALVDAMCQVSSSEDRTRLADDLRNLVNAIKDHGEHSIGTFESDYIHEKGPAVANLARRLQFLLTSYHQQTRLAAIACITALLRVDSESIHAKIQRTANAIRVLYNIPLTDIPTARAAAELVAELSQFNNPMADRVVEAVLFNAINFIGVTSFSDTPQPQVSMGRARAVIVVGVLAAVPRMPFPIYDQQQRLRKDIWVVIWDKDIVVRVEGVRALQAIFRTLFVRVGPSFAENAICDAMCILRRTLAPGVAEFGSNATHPRSSAKDFSTVHGSLVMLASLLREKETNKYLLAFSSELCSLALPYQNSKETTVRQVVADILPLVVQLDRTQFASKFLDTVHSSTLKLIRNVKFPAEERGRSLISLAVIAEEMPADVDLTRLLSDLLQECRKPLRKLDPNEIPERDVISTISHLASAARGSRVLEKELRAGLLFEMFRTDFTNELVTALDNVGKCVPDFAETIRVRLVHLIAGTLKHRLPNRKYGVAADQHIRTARERKHERRKNAPGVSLPKTRSFPSSTGSTAKGTGSPSERKEHSSPPRAPVEEPELDQSGARNFFRQVPIAEELHRIDSNAVTPFQSGATSPYGWVREKQKSQSSSQSYQKQGMPDIARGADLEPDDRENSPCVALKAIINYEFTGLVVKDFCSLTNEFVIGYVEYNRVKVRALAVAASAKLMLSAATISNNGRHMLIQEVHSTLEQFLSVAVADPSTDVRYVAIRALDEPVFYPYLLQPEMLAKLFLCFHDASLAIRDSALSLACHLSHDNPAHVLPPLRRYLRCLMRVLRCDGSFFAKDRREAAEIVYSLVRNSSDLILPYTSALVHALMVRLQEAQHNNDTVSELPVLLTIAEMGGTMNKIDLRPYQTELVPLLVGSVTEAQGAETVYRKAALRALTAFVQNTGFVLKPYAMHPSLLPKLLQLLKSENDASVRILVEILLGSLGAVDPGENKYAGIPDYYGGSQSLGEKTPGGGSQGKSVVKLGSSGVNIAAFWGLPTLRFLRYAGRLHGQQASGSASERQEGVRAFRRIHKGSPLYEDKMPKGHLSKKSQSFDHHARGSQDDAVEVSLSLFAGGAIELSEKLSGYQPCWAKEYISSDSLVASLHHPFTASPHYFPSAALDSLHEIIANPKLRLQHREACQAIVNILRSVGTLYPDFFAAVVPRMLILIVQSGPKDISYPGSFTQLQQHVVQRLADIVDTAGYYYRPFAFDTVLLVWTYLHTSKSSVACATSVCNLLSRLRVAITDEFKPIVATVLPPLLCALADDETSKGTIANAVLRTLESFGSMLEDYREVVFTSLSKIMMTKRSNLVRENVLRTLIYLVKDMRSTQLLSGVLHPLLQVLAGTSDDPLVPGDAKQSNSRAQRPQTIVQNIGNSKLAALAAVALTEIGSRAKKDFRVFVPVVTKALRASGMKSQNQVVYLRLKTLLMRCDPDVVSDLLPEDHDIIQTAQRVKSNSGLNVIQSQTPGQLQRDLNDKGSGSLGGCIFSRPGTQWDLRVHVAEAPLISKWDITLNSRSEDWVNWIDALGAAMFAESGSPAFRACARIADSYPTFTKELFNAVFLSCWTTALSRAVRMKIHESLDAALSSETIPLPVLQAILNLYEYMDHDEKPLPGGILKLAPAAFKCGAFAKAVRYREQEYKGHLADPNQMKEDIYGEDGLISIYEKLGHVESAVGTITHYQGHTSDIVQEEWLEKLQRWDEALAVYKRSDVPYPNDTAVVSSWHGTDRRWNHLLGRLRCLNELGEWPQMNSLVEQMRKSYDGCIDALQQLAVEGKATSVAFDLGHWDEFEDWVNFLRPDSYDAYFYGTLVSVKRGRDDPSCLDDAEKFLYEARRMLDQELTARVSEAYPRAYAHVVGAQVLVELEEMIAYLRMPKGDLDMYGKRRLHELWSERLKGCKQDRSTWYRLLMTRALVVEPIEAKDQWLEFATMCRKTNRLPMASEALRMLLTSYLKKDIGQVSEDGLHSEVPVPLSGLQDWTTASILNIQDLNIKFACIKLIWATDKKVEAYDALQACRYEYWPEELLRSSVVFTSVDSAVGGKDVKRTLAGDAFSVLAKWGDRILDGSTDPPIDPERPLLYAEQTTRIRPDWYKSWHYWGTMNASRFEALMEKETGNDPNKKAWHFAKDIKSLRHGQAGRKYLVNAITGFFRAIDLEGKSRLQDTLKLLTLWFNYGGHANLHVEFDKFFDVTNIIMWVEVVPQIIARLHSPAPGVQKGVISFLTRLGKEHPQVAVYPLTVAKSAVGILQEERGVAATSILEVLRHDHRDIVEQSELVAEELVRAAILWMEIWHQKLEDAYKLFAMDNNIGGMLDKLLPLHAMIENGPETICEADFLKDFGEQLYEAGGICKRTQAELRNGTSENVLRAYVEHVWSIYHGVFRKIQQQQSVMLFDMQKVSGRLHRAKDLIIAVPGTYNPNPGAEITRIQSFSPQLQVLQSKQRPRKFSMMGSDGQQYQFLLKGHEDLRQDERVMQVFGLINKLFVNSSKRTILKGVGLKTYAVIALSANAGLIEWVPNCDTMHTLVRDYRELRKIMPNIEYKVMLEIAPEPDRLSLLKKVDIFETMLEKTLGADICRVLWLKSRNSEMWLERRNTYAKSLATTSMAGYLLGLGDRHPSNLMIERDTGKVLHIDFGDCFEVAMKREKYPEKIPFRLTRMLVNALEPCGVHGYFRHTAEATMHILREKDARESLMAMMEAFVYDPLIRWKFLETEELVQIRKQKEKAANADRGQKQGSASNARSSHSVRFAQVASDDPIVQSLRETGSLAASVRELERQERLAQAEIETEMHEGAIPTASGPANETAQNEDTVFDPTRLQTPNHQARLEQQRAFLETDPTHDFVANVSNSKAQLALNRFEHKLCGTDFDPEVPLSVSNQVELLIRDAQNIEHLCALFMGWCPFW